MGKLSEALTTTGHTEPAAPVGPRIDAALASLDEADRADLLDLLAPSSVWRHTQLADVITALGFPVSVSTVGEYRRKLKRG